MTGWAEAARAAVLSRDGLRATWRRWAYLVLGGALLVPFGVLGSLASTVLPDLGTRYAADAVVLVLVAPVAALVAGLVPGVRTLEDAASRELLEGPLRGLPPPADDPDRPARRRAAAWFALHVVAGGAVSAVSLVLPAGGAVLAADAVPAALRIPAGAVGVVVGVLLLSVLTAAVGTALARAAPAFLGPSAADRVAALERRTAELAERNRLARELHDSVGHALSAVTLQAAAAGRVLERDPAFAREALTAIEETGRQALAELDAVLGLLREDGAARVPVPAAPSLSELPALVRRMQAAGVRVDADPAPEVPEAVSREAYRIVQESITNAVRHAPDRPVAVRLARHAEGLRIDVRNPLPPVAVPGHGGGRGLHLMAERVAALGGTAEAGPRGGSWHVAVRLPLPAPSAARAAAAAARVPDRGAADDR